MPTPLEAILEGELRKLCHTRKWHGPSLGRDASWLAEKRAELAIAEEKVDNTKTQIAQAIKDLGDKETLVLNVDSKIETVVGYLMTHGHEDSDARWQEILSTKRYIHPQEEQS